MVFFLIIFVHNQTRGMKDFVLKNGLTLGAIQVVMLFVSYLMGIDFMMQTWWGIVQFVISLGLVVYFATIFRRAQGEYASFKEMFSISFGLYAASSFILTFFNILLYNFIDLEFAEMAKEVIIEKTYQMMEGFGASETMVDEAIEEIEKQDSFSIASLAKGYVFGLPVYIVISLILAAFLKRNKPEFEA